MGWAYTMGLLRHVFFCGWVLLTTLWFFVLLFSLWFFANAIPPL